MTGQDPLLRRAFGAWRRWPLWALTISLSSAIWLIATVTAPLATDAAADRAFVAEVERADVGRPAGGIDAIATVSNLGDPEAARMIRDELDAMDGYDDAVVSVSPLAPYTGALAPTGLVLANGRSAAAFVYGRDDLVPRLDFVDEAEQADQGDGVWLPVDVADELGVAPGDEVQLVLRYPSGAGRDEPAPVSLRLAGTYRTEDGRPIVDGGPATFRLPRDPVDGSRTAVLAITDPAVAMTSGKAMGDRPLVSWDLSYAGAVTLEGGRNAVRSIDRARSAFRESDTQLADALDAEGATDVTLRSSVDVFVERSQRAADELAPVLDALAVTGRLIGAAVTVLAVILLCRVRRRELALMTTIGSSPLRIGAIITAELLLPVAVGVAAAYSTVRWAPSLVAGSGAIDSSTADDALSSLVRWMPAPVLAVAGAALAVAWSADAVTTARARRLASVVNPGTIVTVATVVSFAQLLSEGGTALDSVSSLLFPTLATLAVAIGAANLTSVVVRRARRRAGGGRPRSMWRWLAVRRLRSSVVELTGVVVVLTAGVGMFVYASSVAAAGSDGISDKAAALGGAPTTALLYQGGEGLELGADGFPDDLPPDSIVLWRVSSLRAGEVRAGGRTTDVLGVNPDGFAAVAEWRDSFADRSLDDLLADIDDAEPGVIDVILAGRYNDEFADDGWIGFGRAGRVVRYHVVARINAGPWQRLRAPLMIASAPVLATTLADGEPVPAVETLDRAMGTYVWSRLDTGELIDRFPGELRFDDDVVTDIPTAEREPAFVAFSLSLPYLRTVGIGLLALGLAATVVLGSRRSDALAADLAITRQMGISARTMFTAGAASSMIVAGVAAAVGVVTAAVLALFMIGRLDPAPEFPPHFVGRVSWTSVVVALGASIVAAFAGALLEQRAAVRRPVGEVLRGAE